MRDLTTRTDSLEIALHGTEFAAVPPIFFLPNFANTFASVPLCPPLNRTKKLCSVREKLVKIWYNLDMNDRGPHILLAEDEPQFVYLIQRYADRSSYRLGIRDGAVIS